jgi:hypothetical protein
MKELDALSYCVDTAAEANRRIAQKICAPTKPNIRCSPVSLGD